MWDALCNITDLLATVGDLVAVTFHLQHYGFSDRALWLQIMALHQQPRVSLVIGGNQTLGTALGLGSAHPSQGLGSKLAGR